MGRKKSLWKRENRKHTVVLTEAAEATLRNVRSKSTAFDLSRFVSEVIIRRFALTDKEVLKQLQQDMIKARDEEMDHLFNAWLKKQEAIGAQLEALENKDGKEVQQTIFESG